MPYINESDRSILDKEINALVLALKATALENQNIFENESLSNEQLLSIVGNINYCISRLCGSIMGKISYPKIAIITGVLENTKQEFYRRVATKYEDAKIVSNGDIPEYKRV
jgi:hypothetical protein